MADHRREELFLAHDIVEGPPHRGAVAHFEEAALYLLITRDVGRHLKRGEHGDAGAQQRAHRAEGARQRGLEGDVAEYRYPQHKGV